MTQARKAWDLFQTAPVMMHHPAWDDNGHKAPVIVSKIKDGIVVWSLRDLVQPYTFGLVEYPHINGKLEFEAGKNRWIYHKRGRDYEFYLPRADDLKWYQDNMYEGLIIDYLQKQASEMYDRRGE